MVYALFCCLIIMLMSGIRSINLLNYKKEKFSFECGFESYSINRMPFSLNFFMISLIFVLFDLEILILVMILPSMTSSSINPFILSHIFLIFMILSLIMEWYMNKLKWII
uniref:NADH-ubiquinone oxidoreductase chain 3 n=1 Tax=Eucoleus annulatus TaxID=2831232 RepID=A0A8E8HT00_9BILA|nr:NADH dehydrogenase subunit 3 [Eucoleus annulatus]QWC93306.1 NADH dehydrogenase subunit 3 [Eucoleus annulatus]